MDASLEPVPCSYISWPQFFVSCETFGYQRLICSVHTLLPLESWLQYDYKFQTLAVMDPLLWWDQQHSDLWLECLASSHQSTKHWPCPYCRATNHFPENVHGLLFVPKRRSHLTIEHLTLNHWAAQSAECSIKEIALTQSALTNTSVLPVKEITLGSPAQQGRDSPSVSNNIQASLRPLTFECEASLPHLPFSMHSTPTPLCSELTLSVYSQPSDSTHHSPHDTSAFQFERLSPEHYPVS